MPPLVEPAIAYWLKAWTARSTALGYAEALNHLASWLQLLPKSTTRSDATSPEVPAANVAWPILCGQLRLEH